MKTPKSVAVASRSFGRHAQLRSELEAKYERAIYNETGRNLAGQELVNFLKGHELAIIGQEVIDEPLLAQTPSLKVIGKYGVGMDKIDLGALARHGVRIGWTGGVNKRSVAELALAFMLVTLRHLPAHYLALMNGNWISIKGNTLMGKTVGIVGCGHIGKDLVELLAPFRCEILVNDIRDYFDFYSQYNLKPVTLDELLRRSNIVSLHVPLDDSTRGLLNAPRLSLLKRDAILINTARGGLVDETTLKDMLKTGRLRSAAFDVFAIEPATDVELLNLSNFFATPHVGGGSEEAALAMGRAAILGLESAIDAGDLARQLRDA